MEILLPWWPVGEQGKQDSRSKKIHHHFYGMIGVFFESELWVDRHNGRESARGTIHISQLFVLVF